MKLADEAIYNGGTDAGCIGYPVLDQAA